MKVVSIAILVIVGLVPALSQANAQIRMKKHRIHHWRVLRYAPPSPYAPVTYDGLYDAYGAPLRTVQPTDVGIGALAPNGYRGPGTASGGPVGGLTTGGGR